jgi:hypothetical protein
MYIICLPNITIMHIPGRWVKFSNSEWMVSLEHWKKAKKWKIPLLTDKYFEHKKCHNMLRTFKFCFCHLTVHQFADSTSGIIHVAKVNYRSRLVWWILANNSVCHDILEAIQVICVACKTLNAATTVNCFQKARIVP